MKTRVFIFSSFLVLGVVLFVAVILQTGIGEIWHTIRTFSLFNFCAFLFLSFLNFCLYTLRWDLIIRNIYGDKPNVKFHKLFLHRMSGFAISYLTPSAQTGGEPMRVMMLSDDKVPTKHATASVIIDKALEIASLFVFIGVGMGLAIIDGSLPGKTEILLIAVLVALVFIIFWFYFTSIKNIGFFSSIIRVLHINKIKRFRRIEEKILGIEEQMAVFYRKHLSTFMLLIVISFFISAFLLLEHYLIARFLGVQLTFFQTFIVSTLPYIAYIIPIPGALGLLEGGHAATFALLGININAFVLVFIIRIRDLVFVFIGLAHASKQGIALLKEAFSRNGSRN
ncbi:lysylphosphatidylglycerol synthase transmembrane domain-containing protein [Pseudomonadota bacterium]